MGVEQGRVGRERERHDKRFSSNHIVLRHRVLSQRIEAHRTFACQALQGRLARLGLGTAGGSSGRESRQH